VIQGTASCLKVRELPSVESAVVDCLRDGTEVPLTGASERDVQYVWRRIVDKGWAVAEYLQRTRAVVSGTASCLNVRETPTTRAPVLTCLPDGSSVVIDSNASAAEAKDWVRVTGITSPKDGGWVIDAYLD